MHGGDWASRQNLVNLLPQGGLGTASPAELDPAGSLIPFPKEHTCATAHEQGRRTNGRVGSAPHEDRDCDT
jgi:hypothetical protein